MPTKYRVKMKISKCIIRKKIRISNYTQLNIRLWKKKEKEKSQLSERKPEKYRV